MSESDPDPTRFRFSLTFLFIWMLLTSSMMMLLFDVDSSHLYGTEWVTTTNPSTGDVQHYDLNKYGLYFSNYAMRPTDNFTYNKEFSITGIIGNLGLDALLMYYVCKISAYILSRRSAAVKNE